MEGDRASSPSFWSQSKKAPSFSPPPPSSSSGIRPWVLVLLASIFVILFIPSFLSSNFRGFRPSLLKNGWDTLNLALVVFAILCGLLGHDVASDDGGGGSNQQGEEIAALPPPPPQYSPVPDQNVYEANPTVGIRRMRNSSSYPDLRREFEACEDWGVTASWRFADDIQIYRRRRLDLNQWESSGEPGIKQIQVDTFELTKSPSRSRSPPETLPPPTPPQPPPPPPLPAAKEVRQPGRISVKKLPHTPPEAETGAEVTLPPATPPPPPPPPPPVFPEQNKTNQKKRSSAAAKDIATAIALFYNKKKRRSKAKKIHDNESLASASPSTPPPPPPPPPPPSVFSQLFSQKKGVRKSTRFSPPPPPPPPPPKKENSLFSDHPRKKRENRTTFMYTYPIAPPSPLPPPPPPPPPPVDDVDGGDAKFAGVGKSSPFCPSPDVNNKADVFIKRFRNGLKLEKLNSIREKQRRQQDPPQEWQQEAGIEMEMEQEIMKMMMMGIGDLSDE